MKKGNWHIWPNGDPLFMGLIHWWLHLINISGCVGSQNDFCRKTKKKISIRRRRRKEGGNGWTSGGTTKLLIQGWRDFRGNSNQPSLLDKSSKKRGVTLVHFWCTMGVIGWKRVIVGPDHDHLWKNIMGSVDLLSHFKKVKCDSWT